MLNAAVVGLGWWGRKIVTTLAGNGRIRVVAGVDPDADIARDLIADHGLRYLDDYDKALADEAIDAVILATPHSLHEAQVVAAAAAGKQVFCEKPLALTTGDIVSVQLEFAGGATGYLVAISATPFYGRLTVFGADGWLEARDDAHVEQGGISRLTVCDAAGRRTETAFEPYDAVRANFEAWAAAVGGAGDYRFRPEQMFQNIATLEAIVRSAASGRSEPVAAAL